MTTFHLGDLLTVTTGKFLSPDIHNVLALADHLASTVHMTTDLPDAVEALAPHLLLQHPWLSEIEAPVVFDSQADAQAWMAAAIARYGEHHDVAPIPPGHYTPPRTPLHELLDNLGARD